jgi:hypothetical protein
VFYKRQSGLCRDRTFKLPTLNECITRYPTCPCYECWCATDSHKLRGLLSGAVKYKIRNGWREHCRIVWTFLVGVHVVRMFEMSTSRLNEEESELSEERKVRSVLTAGIGHEATLASSLWVSKEDSGFALQEPRPRRSRRVKKSGDWAQTFELSRAG